MSSSAAAEVSLSWALPLDHDRACAIFPLRTVPSDPTRPGEGPLDGVLAALLPLSLPSPLPFPFLSSGRLLGFGLGLTEAASSVSFKPADGFLGSPWSGFLPWEPGHLASGSGIRCGNILDCFLLNHRVLSLPFDVSSDDVSNVLICLLGISLIEAIACNHIVCHQAGIPDLPP